VEEWFSGYQESREYRALGIGGLMGDVVERMVGSVEKNTNDGMDEVGDNHKGRGGEKAIRFGLSGCHDTTLAAVLASLGTFENEKWPPYTSHIALELFKKSEAKAQTGNKRKAEDNPPVSHDSKVRKGWFGKIFANTVDVKADPNAAVGIARQNFTDLKASDRSKLDGYFVRIRYNDKVVSIPGCKSVGKHFDGDESFCTLEAFKTIVDKYTPLHWKQGCLSNMDASAFPGKPEPAGY